MASRMIRCEHCGGRYVPLVLKGNKIICPECGEEIRPSVSPPQHDSVSPKPIESTTRQGVL